MCLQLLEQFGTIFGPPLYQCDADDFGQHTDFACSHVGNALVENPAQAFLVDVDTYGKFIAAAQGRFVVNLNAVDNKVDAPFVIIGKADAGGEQELVSCVLQIVLVIGIVDYALDIAFVVAYFHGKTKKTVVIHFQNNFTDG